MSRPVILLTLLTVVRAYYPTAWPYENEAYVPPELPDATPSRTYDESDKGGYFFTLMNTDQDQVQEEGYRANTNTESGMYPPGTAWAPAGSGAFEFVLVVQYGIVPTLPFQNWNCTDRDSGVYSASDYTGVVSGRNTQTVCVVNECCKDWYGLDKWSDDAMSYHEWLNKQASFGLCDDVIEPIYCQLVDNHYRTNCYELRPTTTERRVDYGCPDTHMNYWMSCSVYKTVKMFHGYVMEPVHYTDAQTQEQSILQEVAFQANDKVCHPYSYYFPDTAKGDSATSGTTSTASEGTATASEENTSSAESESSAAPFVAFFALAAMLF